MSDRYEPGDFEAKWRERWQEAELFRTTEESERPKFYALDFFPYPSGAGLSVGHARNYVPTDVISRMKRMQGFNVLHPMGFDAFGLPAENEAIKRQTHPAEMIDRYADRYREQMDLIGIGFDWSRSFKSSDPSYYKWTQWIFELLWERGLAYRKDAAVNWDPIDKTVLADEEVVGGRAERSGALVEKKYIPQWFFKITDYAQRLIDDLDTIDWPEGIKHQQRNWIGRSEGVEFELKVADSVDDGPASTVAGSDVSLSVGERKLSFRVFTTRIDTVFGMTFCVLAPEHPLVARLPGTEEDKARVHAYQEAARTISDVDRQAEGREKTGVPTGAYAINPVNGARVPIWIADYVLATYGTGAIMAVPAHDQRDFDFAVKFDLDVIPVIEPYEEWLTARETDRSTYLANPKAFSPVWEAKDGNLVNSGEYDGLSVPLAQQSLGEWLEALGIGERKIQYKLRDWLISRQRYWGCPIPIIHDSEGHMEAVAESQLPVELPMVDNYEPSGDGTSPLAHIPDFVNVTDSHGCLAKRETDTMGGFACSSWYFLRFCDPDNFEAAWSPEKLAYWMPVDCYVGGAEHAVMHLLYARFWTKVLFDAGLVPVSEPFARLQNQGQVLGRTPYRKPREGESLGVGEEGILISYAEAKEMPEGDISWRWARMSKSKGNVVTPDEMVEQFGADALRLYLLFKAPFHADIEWENKGVEDLAKFLNRVFRLAATLRDKYDSEWKTNLAINEPTELARKIRRGTHQTIRNVQTDIEKFGFNTYVSWLMKYVNGLNDALGKATEAEWAALSEAHDVLVLLLSPGAPHSADELYELAGNIGFTYTAEWPVYEEALAAEDAATIAVQVNGKLRDTFEIAVDATKEETEATALALPKIMAHTEGKTVRKVIVVPGKLVNVVVG
ncbi:leucine--tRNA ligase [bacterium]|nr:MAG: leucine--tRNA ligase [bacterium]